MPRKERGEGDGGKGSKNPLADMFNLQMPDDDEESLMAELAALQGVKPASKGELNRALNPHLKVSFAGR